MDGRDSRGVSKLRLRRATGEVSFPRKRESSLSDKVRYSIGRGHRYGKVFLLVKLKKLTLTQTSFMLVFIEAYYL